MGAKKPAASDFNLVYYSGNRKTGSVAIVRSRQGKIEVKSLPVAAASSLPPELKPVLLGVTADGVINLLDPKTKKLSQVNEFPADAFAAHLYSDPYSNRDWFMNDGDKDSGNDTLNCGNQGSSVTVIEGAGTSTPRYLQTVCVGRGHHQATFSAPSPQAPQTRNTAYISNLKDGTISVIGNDANDKASDLKVTATINLCEAERENGQANLLPNNAFPHGIAYSRLTGKLYNLNNGYGSLVVINPQTNAIEHRTSLKGHSNLFASPNERFLIGRGADRKSDAQHVIAKISSFDVTTNKIANSLDLPDIYLSKYYYNAEGTKLYFTTDVSGSPEQQQNCKKGVLLVFDLTALPTIKLAKEIQVGSTASVAFHAVNGKTERVFCADVSHGKLVVIDGQSDEIVDTISVGEGVPHGRIWMASEK